MMVGSSLVKTDSYCRFKISAYPKEVCNHYHQLERTLDVLLTRRYNRVSISINSLISVNI
jgi:hypothetical protein